MKEVADEHAEADRLFLKAWRDNPQAAPCCKAGCSACCSEIVYASEAEVLHIIEALTPEQVEALKPKLLDWLEKTKSVRKQKSPDAANYRLMNLPCFFLKNGLCSIYERRPFGCRSFFALANPENCEMPMRRHQKFALWGEDFYRRLKSVTIVDDYLTLDHLGVLLAERLLHLKIPSAARKKAHKSELRVEK